MLRSYPNKTATKITVTHVDRQGVKRLARFVGADDQQLIIQCCNRDWGPGRLAPRGKGRYEWKLAVQT